MVRLIQVLAIGALANSLLACAGGSGGGDSSSVGPESVGSLQRATNQAADDIIIPAATRFLDSAVVMRVSAENFCANPEESRLAELQESWRSAFLFWYQLAPYNFGPLDDDIVFPGYSFIDSLRLRGTDYTETVRTEISADITGAATLDDGYFAAKTFQYVGLLALESSVFETSTSEHSGAAVDILAEYSAVPRKCQVLQGLARQLVERARYVEQAWTVAYQDSEQPYRALFVSGQLDDGMKSIDQVVIAAQQYLDYLQARQVVRTAGQISMNSWEAISASIDEVELLLRGDTSATDSIFATMKIKGNENFIPAVESSIEQVRQSIADQNVDMLEITLGFLDGNFKREIPDGLNVDLGINFSDGD